jgi:hypothetical protein
MRNVGLNDPGETTLLVQVAPLIPNRLERLENLQRTVAHTGTLQGREDRVELGRHSTIPVVRQ